MVRSVTVTARVAGALLLLAGCATPQAAPPAAVTVTEASTTVTAVPSTAVSGPVPARLATIAPVTSTGESVVASVTQTAASAVMPDVVCMDLQQAQDMIQGAGVFFSRSADATGQGRAQVLDRHWVVVAQTPDAGRPVGELEAVLSVVKDNEPNPC